MSVAARVPRSFIVRGMPVVFVLLWATGFIGAKYGLPYAEPFTFLTLRFMVTVTLLLPFALFSGAKWPKGWKQIGHVALVGLLVHGIYLGGVFAAIGRGMPAGLTALLMALQPILTATLVGPLLGERVTRRQMLGLALGLAGVAMVLSGKLDLASGGALFRGFDLSAVLLALMALLGITVGVIYQKRFAADVDLRAGAVVQYVAAGLFTGGVALLFETREVAWGGEFLFALGWLVLVLSIGAISLLMLLIRMGAASRTASLFYLVPPVTAVIAYLLFDERLDALALAGMAVAVAGVALVVSRPRS